MGTVTEQSKRQTSEVDGRRWIGDRNRECGSYCLFRTAVEVTEVLLCVYASFPLDILSWGQKLVQCRRRDRIEL